MALRFHSAGLLGLLLLGVFAVGCKAPEGLNADRGVICENNPDGKGTWEPYDVPTDPYYEDVSLAGIMASDGQDLVFLHSIGPCDWCEQLYVLDPETSTWTGKEKTGAPGMDPWGNFIVSPDYVFVQGGSERMTGAGPAPRVYTSNAAVLERETATWTVVPAPAGWEDRTGFGATAFFTGTHFGVFSGLISHAEDIYLESDTKVSRFLDGQLLDPTTHGWTPIPELMPEEVHVYGVHNPQGDVQSIWTERGLFVFGLQGGKTAFAALYSVETGEWERFSSGLPEARLAHRLATSGDSVFVFGGYTPGGGLRRDLWELKLSTGEWTEIDVPGYVDTKRGAVYKNKLVFVGTCASAAYLDLETRTWEQVTSTGAVFEGYLGELAVTDDRLYLHSVDFLELGPVYLVWALTL